MKPFLYAIALVLGAAGTIVLCVGGAIGGVMVLAAGKVRGWADG